MMFLNVSCRKPESKYTSEYNASLLSKHLNLILSCFCLVHYSLLYPSKKNQQTNCFKQWNYLIFCEARIILHLLCHGTHLVEHIHVHKQLRFFFLYASRRRKQTLDVYLQRTPCSREQDTEMCL